MSPEREHHKHIVRILNELNAEMLVRLQTSFGGGTAISLLLGEYRLSTDIDFLCSAQEAYRELRALFFDPRQRKKFLGNTLIEQREWRADMYAIRGLVSIHGSPPIKMEFVSEARISLAPGETTLVAAPHIPLLTRTDLFAEKLLANEDRGLDEAFRSRDIIDIAFMQMAWGDIPAQAWQKFHEAYGTSASLQRRFKASKALLENPFYLDRCLQQLAIDEARRTPLLKTLGLAEIPRSEATPRHY